MEYVTKISAHIFVSGEIFILYKFFKWFEGGIILITNKTVDKKSSHNPYMQDYARFFVQFLIGY